MIFFVDFKIFSGLFDFENCFKLLNKYNWYESSFEDMGFIVFVIVVKWYVIFLILVIIYRLKWK